MKIKQCPCCGWKPKVSQSEGIFRIECLNITCGISGGSFGDEHEAIVMWNKRVLE